jgi:hypothetical protein
MTFLSLKEQTYFVMLQRVSGRGETVAASLGLNLDKLRLDQLQEAIRANQVTFPSQVPVFIKHSAGMQQCHIVLLYFVLGWSCDRIAKRYEVTRQHIWQIVSEWRRHAVALGYLQVIPPPEVLTPLQVMRPSAPRPVFQPVPAAAEADLVLA